MRRVLVGLAVLATAFGGGLGIGLLTRSEAHTRIVLRTTVEVVNGSRTAKRRPAPIPTLLEGATDPHRLALSSAVPIDANLDSADYVSFSHRRLVVREGLDFRGPGIHCCYRKVRETWLRWDGRRLITVRKEVRKNRRGWPPG